MTNSKVICAIKKFLIKIIFYTQNLQKLCKMLCKTVMMNWTIFLQPSAAGFSVPVVGRLVVKLNVAEVVAVGMIGVWVVEGVVGTGVDKYKASQSAISERYFTFKSMFSLTAERCQS